MNTHRVQRFFAWFLHAAEPVDGDARRDEARSRAADWRAAQGRDEILQRAESEPHEPLRWGNFR